MAKKRRRLTSEPLESRNLLASIPLGPFAPPFKGEAGTPVQRDASLLRAAEIRFQYDPSVLRIQPDDLRAGAIWKGEASVIANVDEEAGIVTAFVFSATAVNGGDGDLLEFTVGPTSNADCSNEPIIKVQKVRLNEGAIELKNRPVAVVDRAESVVAPTDVPMKSSLVSHPPPSPPSEEAFIGPVRPDHVDLIMHHYRPLTLREQMLPSQH